ncbi:hypothetical protein IT409_02040 [Candidatus Falkowbacteria bacterium]|nr:hypothetical protein [Candidatus Falkowbacteria bacterium]
MKLMLPSVEPARIKHHLATIKLDSSSIEWICDDESDVVNVINPGARFCCWCGVIVHKQAMILVRARILVENKQWHKGLAYMEIPFAFCDISEYKRHINISRYGQ